MENLHAPTIPSGPTSGPGAANGMQTNGLTFAQLQAKKDNIEAEIKALSGHAVDMNTRLLTPDGFPRADLDVAQIRTTKSQIIYLKNDHKALMSVIEKHIHEHFARLAETPNTEEPAVDEVQASRIVPSFDEPAPLDVPFAKVKSVAAGSPADEAGLKAGDTIRNFGYVNHANNDGLKRVGECVQGNEGREVMVKVSRDLGRQELQLSLTPRRKWGGRGLLGCKILPL
ncbi:hypothetical protein BOTNAR_0567g00030 [Botryotinia narcissicola]|uniref:Probable 26S proteasome regulatory subunit p27 n=1 Tax=Botryotinia narcissicola TaxID=278944 RepID=A0A4Z1HCX9_9HELO|nr:hypothetical protein BOTNAR_0567g00030 [Botryotinia narcissicola]